MPNMLPIYAFTDSKSLCENINSTNQATDLKLRREVEGIRQLGEIMHLDSYGTAAGRLFNKKHCITRKSHWMSNNRRTSFHRKLRINLHQLSRWVKTNQARNMNPWTVCL